tara:strand:+ start:1046 stop:1447 length:402 start_codon:yes stop_codon:yes gene_type:complete
MEELLNNIKESEGYRDKVYKCTEGFDTIGYGFAIKDLVLEEDICDIILARKIEKLMVKIQKKFPFITELPSDKSEVVIEMCYQMGVTGVSKFKKMLKHLEDGNFEKASIEMLDSKWAKQTPNRALKLSNAMKK